MTQLMFLIGIAAAGLVGSAHCAAMCGPIVCCAVGDRKRVWKALAYNQAGRLATYVCAGAIAGAVGGRINAAGNLMGVQRLAAWIAGTLLIIVGIYSLGRVRRWMARFAPARWLANRLNRIGRVANRFRGRWRWFAMGALTGFMPCGWLYLFLLAAATTGSAPMGAATMSVFWLSTSPVLIGVAVGYRSLSAAAKARLPQISAILLILTGIFTLSHRASIASIHSQANETTQAESLEQVWTEKPACCHDSEEDQAP